VTYRYDQVTALNAVSMAVQQGERVALLGANGCGKSTLLRLLAGLYFPQQGEISFCGESITEERLEDERFSFDFRRRVGLVFQNPDVQLFNPSVFDEIAFGPLQLRWPKERIRGEVGKILETMNIAHLKDRPPHRLSGGEKKRVALASVLILDPEVLLLDEPTASLDPDTADWVRGRLDQYRRTHRATILLASHNMYEVERLCERVIIMKTGRIEGDDTPQALLAHYGRETLEEVFLDVARGRAREAAQ